MRTLFILLFCGFIVSVSYAQQDTSTTAGKVAFKHAKRLRDSLALTVQKQKQLYNVCMQLHKQKMQVRKDYPGDMQKIQQETQRIENTRDSLYKNVLSAQEYNMYLQKKRKIILAN